MRFIDIKDPTPLKLASVLRKRQRIANLCRRHGIDLLFLHGSLARDRHGPLGDIDLAVSGRRIGFKKSLEIQRDLADLFGRDDVDLVILDRASSLLAMQVLMKGIPLYRKSERVLREFRYRTFQKYLDSQHLRSRFADYVTQAVL